MGTDRPPVAVWLRRGIRMYGMGGEQGRLGQAVGVGRAAYVVMVSGVLLAMVAVALIFFKDVRDLEQNEKTIDRQ